MYKVRCRPSSDQVVWPDAINAADEGTIGTSFVSIEQKLEFLNDDAQRVVRVELENRHGV